jgi:hypothetical protein
MTTPIASTYNTTFPLSDAGELRIRIAKLALGPAMAFRRRYSATKTRESVRRLSVRLPGEEMARRPVVRPRTEAEQALVAALDAVTLPDDAAAELRALVDAARAVAGPEPTDEDTFVIPDEEIRQRRYAELSADAQAAWQRQVEQEEADEIAFLSEAITAYVSLEPGQVREATPEGDRDIVTGEDILRVWGNKIDDLRALAALIRIENDLTDTRKKALRSLYGLGGSSPAPASEAAGNAPEPIVAPVDAKASAGSAAAMESSAT